MSTDCSCAFRTQIKKEKFNFMSVERIVIRLNDSCNNDCHKLFEFKSEILHERSDEQIQLD